MNSFFNDENPFNSARRSLTLFYCLILLIILVAFSTSLYTVQMNTLSRVVIQREFGNRPPPRIFTYSEVVEFEELAVTLRNDLIKDLVLIDLTILIAGTFLSYILAAKTLEPIGEALESQKKFTADASHELRTPLTAIISAAEVALRNRKKTKADYREVLKQVHSVSQDMSVIVNELLSVSKLGTAPGLEKKQPVDVGELLEKSLSEVSSLAENKHLKVNILKQDKVEVMGDKNKLKQMVIILLDNAIKYTPEGREVRVSLTNSPKRMLKIEDTGIGIEKAELKEIFKRFYRGDKSRSTPGAGLGLSIAREIAILHHASIEVDSKVGRGSEFRVIF